MTGKVRGTASRIFNIFNIKIVPSILTGGFICVCIVTIVFKNPKSNDSSAGFELLKSMAMFCSASICILSWIAIYDGWQIAAFLCLAVATLCLAAPIMIDYLLSMSNSKKPYLASDEHKMAIPMVWYCIMHRRAKKKKRYDIPQLNDLKKHLEDICNLQESIDYCKVIFTAFTVLYTYRRKWCKKRKLMDNPRLLSTATKCFHVCRGYYAAKDKEMAKEFVEKLSLSFITYLIGCNQDEYEYDGSFFADFSVDIINYDRHGIDVFLFIYDTIKIHFIDYDDSNAILKIWILEKTIAILQKHLATTKRMGGINSVAGTA